VALHQADAAAIVVGPECGFRPVLVVEVNAAEARLDHVVSVGVVGFQLVAIGPDHQALVARVTEVQRP
jgi:hypothetical protein